jgi:glycosyltransferase involved in cell wall biosynthesis
VAVRALVVSNMYPSAERPALGSFVRDQVDALRRIGELEVELFTFAPGGAGAYWHAGQALRRRYRATRFDVVHAHFGLSVWPSLGAAATLRAVTLHGTDLVHPRSRLITLGGLRRVDLPAVVSAPLARLVPRWAVRRAPAVLPCGVDLERFRPIPRLTARRELELPESERLLLLPADPARPEKRADRARALADAVGARLLTLGAVDPERVPLWVNAADAVLVTSERESFGLAVLEALACGVPVLATPEGIAPEALDGLAGVLCAPFDLERWSTALEALIAAAEGPAVPGGRERAAEYSADRMAERVVAAWRAGLAGG